MEPAAVTFAGSAAFQYFVQSLGCPGGASAATSFDFVFEDDLPVTVALHPNGTDVAIDVWCFDAAPLIGASRRAVVKTLLLLNQVTVPERPLHIGMDSRDFILVHSRQAMDQLDGVALRERLAWTADQGRRVRGLVRTLVEFNFSGTHDCS